MRIGVYGCSWTAGVATKNDNAYASWAKCLAQLNPEYEIYSYAKGGIGLDAMLYMFEKTRHLYDYNIVKFTGYARQSYIKEDIKLDLERTDNFFTLPMNEQKKVFAYNIGGFNPKYVTEYWSSSILEKGFKPYITYYNKEFAKIKAWANVKYFESIADLCFCHRVWDKEIYDVPCTEENIKNFKTFVFDDGFHLTKEGVWREAVWVDKMIKGKYNKI